jgi:hypothetical protein
MAEPAGSGLASIQIVRPAATAACHVHVKVLSKDIL